MSVAGSSGVDHLAAGVAVVEVVNRGSRLVGHGANNVNDGMAFLLEHLPPQIHLVITTRADPPVPLGRLRAQGELVEIRVADLRFTPDEAAAYAAAGLLGLVSWTTGDLEAAHRSVSWRRFVDALSADAMRVPSHCGLPAGDRG